MPAPTFDQLIAIAKNLGLTDACANEMANEHIANRDASAPRYVRIAMNAALDGKINDKVQTYLDRVFGWNAENVHRFLGLFINRDRAGRWYICQ